MKQYSVFTDTNELKKKTSKETGALIHSIFNHYRVNLRNKGFFIKRHRYGKDHSTKNTI